jgi:hypothetical protein
MRGWRRRRPLAGAPPQVRGDHGGGLPPAARLIPLPDPPQDLYAHAPRQRRHTSGAPDVEDDEDDER